VVRVGKLVVYRGHDNIESLVDFYGKLKDWSGKIEESQFDGEVVRRVIKESYQKYYHTYSDVLMPYYLALLALNFHNAKGTSKASATHLGCLIQQHKPNPLSLIQGIIEH
jgi:hypothetical protein